MMTSPIVGAAPARRPWLFAALLAVLAALAPAPARAAEKPAAKDKGAAADKPGDKSADKAGKARKVTPAEKFLREAEGKLDNFTFGPADLAAAERHAKQAKTPAGRLPFDLLIARYQREYQNRPDRAAAAVLPHLFPKETAAAWEKETAKLRKETPKAAPAKDGKAKTGAKEAQGGEGEGGEGAANAPAAPLAPLPPAGDWNLTPENAPAAVEAAACLAAAGRMAEALSVINRVGADFADANRVRAAETAGDLNFDAASYARAVEFYDYGIKYLNAALGTENAEKRTADGGYAKEYSEHEQALRARLARKRDAAQRRLEADRYGPDWVLYRDATRAEWERHDPAAAWLLYQKIVGEHPGTVYAEAARCYGVKCLLALASANVRAPGRAPGRAANRKGGKGEGAGSQLAQLEPTPAEALAATIRNREWELARAEKLLAAAANSKVARPLLKRLKVALERAEKRVKELKTVPTGDKALKLAEREAEAFLAANQYGLYRGEALLALAEFWLERKLDPAQGEKALARAERWLDEIAEADAGLAALSVPDKAAAVAAPPPSTFFKDDWGNLMPGKPAPGQVVNRRTAEWHADSLRARVYMWQGFLAFMDGDMKRAGELFEKYGQHERFVSHCLANGLPNPTRRLRARLEEGTFIRTTKEELAGFKDKRRRFVVYMADFSNETERFARGAALYRRLLAGEFGALSVAEEAYARYGLTWSLWALAMDSLDFGLERRYEDAGIANAEKFLTDPGLGKSVIAPRALSLLAKVYGNGLRADWQKSLEVFRVIAQKYPSSPHAPTALFRFADLTRALGDETHRKEAVQCLRRLTTKYPGSPFAPVGKKLLTAMEKEK